MSDPVSAAIIAAAAQGAQSSGNFLSQILSNNRNERLMREAWSREDTAVQRRAKDLEASGINPVMAAGSPAGSSPAIRVEAPQFEGNPVGDAYSAAAKVQDISLTASQKNLIDAQADKARAEADMMTRTYTDPDDGSQVSWATLTASKLWNESVRGRLQYELEKRGMSATLAAQAAEKVKSDFMRQHGGEFLNADLKMRKEGASQAEIETRIRSLVEGITQNEKKYWWTKAALGGLSQLVGSASTGMRTFYPGLK